MTEVWIISDGKPGHLNQSLGLAEALQRANPEISITTKPAMSRWQALAVLLSKSLPDTPDNSPALVIGAGHRTHFSLLAYGRATGAKTVLLMKPSLPVKWFDLCLIPRHDRPDPASNIELTDGALNRMQPLAERSAVDFDGMVLIGGPSKHFDWDDEAVVAQLSEIAQGDKRWLLTTSRRTPESFLERLRAAALPNLDIVPFADTGEGWLGQHLPQARECWVSGDSVSMVFEALTSGAAVGVLELSQRQSNRITRGLQLLIDDSKVTAFSRWQETGTLLLPQRPFNEASRCAALVRSRLLK